MAKIAYKTRLIFANNEDKQGLMNVLLAGREAWNACSRVKFTIPNNNIIDLHKKFYKKFRKKNKKIPAQVVIATQRSVLSTYRAIKSNKHKITIAPEKKRLSLQLDKNSCSYKKGVFSIISLGKRVKCKPFLYPKLQELFEKYLFCGPVIFARDNEVWISITFEVPSTISLGKTAVGVDLGIVNFAATSEGNLYKDPKFNKNKRKLRYLKRSLQSCGTKSAKRKLKRLRHKEKNINHNFTHHLANAILKGSRCDTFVLEDLKSIKVKKNKYKIQNRLSQIPLAELRRILTYKALLSSRQVITVSPAYTSQIDCRTGKRDGIREGGRYTGKDGQVLHADINAACNIALKSKHPCSISNYYAWQAIVNSPIVNGSRS